MKRFVPPLCTPKGNTRGGWSGHLGSGIQENPCIKRGHQLLDVGLDHNDGLRVKRRSGISSSHEA
jgi:hypothetical protein